MAARAVADPKGWVEDLLIAPRDLAENLAKLRTASKLKNWVDGVIADLTRRSTDGHRGPGSQAVVQGATNLAGKEAKAVVARAALVGEAPIVGEAMTSGEIGAGHADALARTLDRASPPVRQALLAKAPELVEAAKAMSPEAFADRCRDEARRLEPDDGADLLERQRRQSFLKTWKDGVTGMCCGKFAFDPVRGDALFNAFAAELERLVAERPDHAEPPTETELDQLGAEALHRLVASSRPDGQGNVPGVEVHVLIDYETLIGDLHLQSVCELSDGTPLPVGSARRLACQATIIPVLLGSDGEVLDLGREVRLASRAQRRALRGMYRTCVFPDCRVPFDRCEIHHLFAFELGGHTALVNLAPLCWRHHHLVHEGGWTIRIAPNRDLTVRRPDGTVHATVPFAGRSRAGRSHRGPPPSHAPPNAA